jgi:hypothetical protein
VVNGWVNVTTGTIPDHQWFSSVGGLKLILEHFDLSLITKARKVPFFQKSGFLALMCCKSINKNRK